jgi:AcrR family transcriptional regulator
VNAHRTRLTRAERKRQTRTQLLVVAEQMFRRDGFHGASIEAIAAEAGYTKGAFYGNFADKEEAFLILLRDRFVRRAGAVAAAAARGVAPVGSARQLGRSFARYVTLDPAWQRAFFEFVIHASRSRALARRLRDAEAPLREALCRALGAFPDIVGDRPVELLVDAIWAASTGAALATMHPGSPGCAEPMLDLLLSSILGEEPPR